MPIVFVHGVNNRVDQPSYLQGVARTDAFLRRVFAPAVGLDPAAMTISFPYWGDHGVRFRWSQASLPRQGGETLSLDAALNEAELELWLAELRFQRKGLPVSLVQVSRDEGFLAAVNLVWDTAATVAAHDEVGATHVAEGYAASLAYAAVHPSPKWAREKTLTNEAFVAKLAEEIEPKATAQTETFGLRDKLDALKEALSRLASAPTDKASSLALRFSRESAHDSASRFLGDILTYVSARGRKDDPGPIVRRVIESLEVANAAKKKGDDKLVVIAHSLGGLITYDILTHYRPELALDAWITVGSQVALFEEMTLCRASAAGVPADPASTRLPKPSAVSQWLNVYDTNDVFSFRVDGVFEDARDFAFDTGFSLLQAHGGYFARPSFYKRLAARLLEQAT